MQSPGEWDGEKTNLLQVRLRESSRVTAFPLPPPILSILLIDSLCSPYGQTSFVVLRFAPGLSKKLPFPPAIPAILSKNPLPTAPSGHRTPLQKPATSDPPPFTAFLSPPISLILSILSKNASADSTIS